MSKLERGLGNAEQVRKELESKVAENGAPVAAKATKVNRADKLLALIGASDLMTPEVKAALLASLVKEDVKTTTPNQKDRIKAVVMEVLKANPKGLKDTEVYDAVAPTFAAEPWFNPFSFSCGPLYAILHNSKDKINRDVLTGLSTIAVAKPIAAKK